MSEKVYAWLLRLYPAHFRETYGEAALQLFRDRVRDETGFFPRLRLWLDLIADLAISLPRMRRHAGLWCASGGAPSFHVLEGESLRFGAWFLGAVLTLVAFGMGAFLIGHGGGQRAFSLTAGSAEQTGVSGPPAPENTQARVTAGAEVVKLDAAERQRVIAGAVANLKEYYVYPDAAQKMADALLAHSNSGDDDAVTDGEEFADLLTGQMTDVSHDPHLRLLYSANPLPEGLPGPPPDVIAVYRKAMQQYDCTFAKIEILPHNIGYLQLNSFPDPSICQPAATAAMAKLNDADAIIFDLRYNGGGSPEMAALIATYLFDQPTHLNDVYNRAENSTRQSWTLAPVPGNKLADKPAYVLTSRGTFSGAEEFSYDLKMLKRATIVGATTVGGAHISSPHRIDDHFIIFVPYARSINPISKTDWEGTGVEPDVKVPAADALAKAEQLAESKLAKK